MKKPVVVLVLMTFIIFMGGNGTALAVDGVIEINAARAAVGGVTPGDAPGFPVTISTPGSYRLTGNLTIAASSTNGIEITGDDVTIDLNGFSIIGPGGSGPGTGVNGGTFSRITVLNGVIRDMDDHGVVIGPQSYVSGIHAFDNGGSGIIAGRGSIVSGNTTHSNNAAGISSNQGCVISGNTVHDNGTSGISALSGCTVVNNTARDNTGVGLSGSSSTGYKGNVFGGNNGGDVNAQVSGSPDEIGLNICGTNTTCP